MNCEEFQTIAGDLARDQIMEAGARTQALAHRASCEECAMRWEDELRLNAGLRAFADQMKSLEAGPQVEAQLLTAFRNRVDAKTALVGQRRRLYWIGAAAAAVLVVFSVLAMRGRVGPISRSDTHETAKVMDPPKAPPAVGESVRPPSEMPSAPLSNRKPRRVITGRAVPRSSDPSNRQRTAGSTLAAAVADPTNSEIATDFFPVGDGSAWSLQDGGQLVRVELPRTALERFGLPVNIDRANERVKADVLVGADGLARAIRFVQ